MTITRYRKRPIEVDTIQWTGDNEAELIAFTDHRFEAVPPEDRVENPEITAQVFDVLHSTWVGVYIGQHIVRGVKGEYYPIAEDVLAETYELAAAVPAASEAETGSRVIELYERWVKAGAPPLGTLMARWWDVRLAELHDAISQSVATEAAEPAEEQSLAVPRHAATALHEALGQLLGDESAQATARVRALHREEYGSCAECTHESGVLYPCATICALDEQEKH
jgi:hypothetical protein